MAGLTTHTRRGLVLTLYSEAVLVVLLLAFVAFPHVASLVVWAVLGSAVFGAFAGLAFWAGRREFGPEAERAVRRGMGLFLLLMLSLFLAFYQVTDIVPATLKITDLRAPWFFLGVALAADAAAIHVLLSPLVAAGGRRWIRVVDAVAVVAVLTYLVLGWRSIEDFVARSGGVAANAAEAASYARDFVQEVVRLWAASILALRFGFVPALWAAITNVAEAEVDAQDAIATGSL